MQSKGSRKPRVGFVCREQLAAGSSGYFTANGVERQELSTFYCEAVFHRDFHSHFFTDASELTLYSLLLSSTFLQGGMAKLKQLPEIQGFSRRGDGVLGPLRITADSEDAMAVFLSSMRFQRGKLLAKVYANLIVLFRMLLYYADFRDHALFWFWIRSDWGLLQGDDNPPVETRGIVEFYVQARIRGCCAGEERKSLLARLVDAWRQECGKIARVCSNGVDTMGLDINTRRANWQRLRDNHVDVLMDSRQPACLLGVLLPERTVTSLWEVKQDPVLA